jgi:threonine aldolase
MPAPLSAAERQNIFRTCDRFLIGHGPRRIPAELALLAQAADPDQAGDSYGAGGALEELEREVAVLLGKPAALFLPSGTMAQQIALRVHADRARCSTVAFHPTCHLELHEQRGYARLHGLAACLVGRRDRLLTRADLEQVAEPVAALLLELPQREIGGLLPSWEELCEQASWAQQRGAALHLDGARLWESVPHYGRTLTEVCALFDSVYVSFYKTLGGIAGAALLGSESFIAEAKVWQRRHGGNLVSLYPYVLSAREGLRQRLERVPGYVALARRIAQQFARLPGVRVVPNPPVTNLFHVHWPVEAQRLMDASLVIARERKLALLSRTRPCDVAGHCITEITIGDAASSIPLTELDACLAELFHLATEPSPRSTE